MILPAYGLLILVSLAPLHFFASFSSSVGQDSYIYGLMVALVGGYGNTVPALATLLVGLIGMGRLSIKGDSNGCIFVRKNLRDYYNLTYSDCSFRSRRPSLSEIFCSFTTSTSDSSFRPWFYSYYSYSARSSYLLYEEEIGEI